MFCKSKRNITATSPTARETHVPYGIAQCYLPPGRGDIPAVTPAEASIDLATPEGCKAELT